MWKEIETAPKGGGAKDTRSPNWVKPPTVLLFFEDGKCGIAKWDWYYAPGGNGYDPRYSAWIDTSTGEQSEKEHGRATHWMELPTPPNIGGAEHAVYLMFLANLINERESKKGGYSCSVRWLCLRDDLKKKYMEEAQYLVSAWWDNEKAAQIARGEF